MSEMIERIAWALVRAASEDTPEGAARVVLQAMREPTEAMIDAGMVVPSRSLVRDCWDSMIEEALKEITDGK